MPLILRRLTPLIFRLWRRHAADAVIFADARILPHTMPAAICRYRLLASFDASTLMLKADAIAAASRRASHGNARARYMLENAAVEAHAASSARIPRLLAAVCAATAAICSIRLMKMPLSARAAYR